MLFYEQIINDIIKQLRVGELYPGCALPSIKELRLRYGVSHITCGRVYRELVSRGIGEKHGHGYRVCLREQIGGGKIEEDRKMTLGVFLRPFREPSLLVNDNYMNNINLGVETAIVRSQHDYLRTFAVRSFLDTAMGVPDSVSIIAANLASLGRRTSGMLIDERIPDQAISLFRKESNMPVVLVNRESALPISSVCGDNVGAVDLLVRQARRMGYGCVYYCDEGDTHYWNDSLRRKEFLRLKQEQSEMELGSISLGSSNYLQNASELIVSRSQSKVLFFCNHDLVAKNVCEGLLSMGIRPGEDCGVCGFYGCSYTYGQGQSISSIRFDAKEIGNQAVHLLLNRIRFDWDYQPEHVRLPGEFMLGDSM